MSRNYELQNQLQTKKYRMHFIIYSSQALKAKSVFKTIRALKANQFSTTQLPQGEIQLMNDDSGPQGTISSILAPTAISKIQLDNSLKNSLHTALQSESPYSEILQDLSGGTRQIIKNNLIFKRMKQNACYS